MKKNYLRFNKALSAFIFIALSGTLLNAQTTQTFTFTGAVQSFTVPACVSTITVDVRGAKGGTSWPYSSAINPGGNGGRVVGVMTVTTNQVLNIYVGGIGANGGNGGSSAAGGFNGGGAGAYSGTSYGGGGGGGASDIRVSPYTLSDRKVVAGGGGGGAYNYGVTGYDRGGMGGALTGEAGYSGNTAGSGGYPGGGGTQSAGGGAGFYSGYCGATAGSLGFGGPAGTCGNSGGGGGGGYYGGGGGVWAGGGGGSNYAGPAVTSVVHTQGYQAGAGQVILTYVYAGAITGAAATPSLMCTGSSATLTANGQVSYTWTPGGAITSSIIVSPTSNTSYTVQGTNTFGCISTAVIGVSVDPGLPVLTVANSASATSNGVCPGKTVTLTASGATSYTWAGATAVTNGVSFSPTTSSGYTVTGGNACGTSTAATSVSINPIPAVTAVASTASLCSGNSLTLTGVGTATGYVWSGGSVGANGAGFFPSSTVTYTVIGTNAQTCTNSAMTTVTVVTTPALAPVLSPALICIGKSSTVTASGATNYTWLPGSFGNTTTVILSPTSTTSYTLTKANANCVDIKVFTITVNNLPNIFTLASPTVICASTSATLFGGGANTYTWTAPNFTTTGASPVVSPAVSTTYSVAASDGTCIGINTVFLATNPNPTVTIAATSTAICFGQSITLTANGAANYTWLPSGNNNTVITDSPPTTTVYPITGTNIFGCTNSTSQVVIVNPLPSVNASTNKNLVCVGFPATLTATGANTYLWLNNNAPTAVTVVNPLVTTVFTVVGTYTTTGCSNTKTVQVSVFDPTLTITGSPSVCIGGAITLIAGGAQTYTWNTSPVQNFPAITVSPSVATVYIVTATSLSTAVSCVSSKSISISIYLNPTITAVAQRTVICKFESGNLIANGGDTYVWSTGQTGSVIPVSPLTLNNTYTVTGTDVNGCIGNATVSLKVSGCTGLNEITIGNQQLEIYPNPNSGEFMLRSATDMNLTLTNELGQVIRTISLSELNDYKLLVSNLAPGIYFITGEKDALKISQKIIVTK